MTLEQILAELPKLTEQERQVVEDKLCDLSDEEDHRRILRWESEPPLPLGHWTKVFEDWTGKGEEDVPEDFSLNHDHYIHGAPRKW